MRKYWKITLAMVGVVLLSLFAGALIGARVQREKSRKRANPAAWNLSAMRTLERRLKLSPEQVVKIQGIVDGSVVELQATREETIKKTDRALGRMIREMEKELSPEQVVELMKLCEERKPVTLEMLNVQPRKLP